MPYLYLSAISQKPLSLKFTTRSAVTVRGVPVVSSHCGCAAPRTKMQSLKGFNRVRCAQAQTESSFRVLRTWGVCQRLKNSVFQRFRRQTAPYLPNGIKLLQRKTQLAVFGLVIATACCLFDLFLLIFLAVFCNLTSALLCWSFMLVDK